MNIDIILIVILPIILIVALFGLIPSKGAMGERRVAKLLEKKLPDDYIIVNDITIPCKFGTTQIDHIVVSPYGIFVIETKNYKGWIFGKDDYETWTQNIFGEKYSFYNPIKQNESHIKALQNLLHLDDYCFRSIVTFANSASIRNKHNGLVVNNYNLIESILQYSAIVIPQSDVQLYVDKVLQSALVDKGTKKEHVRNVKRNVEFKNWKIKNNICPRCGGTIVERKGKYGEFYGCSNYPTCKFTMK